jgi:hypothetical protein
MTLGYDRYCFMDSNAQDIVGRVESALNIKLRESESSYVGVHWSAQGITEDEEFDLQSNFIDEEQEWTDPDHKECRYLLEVSGTERSEELERLLKDAFKDKCKLLRREVI